MPGNYEYPLKDLPIAIGMGNSRVTFMGTNLAGAIDVVQTASYYPFGLLMNPEGSNTADIYKKNKYFTMEKKYRMTI